MRAMILGLALLVAAPVQAEGLRFVTQNLPPYSEDNDGKRSGVLIEIVEAMAKSANRPAEIEFMSTLRNQSAVKENSDVAMFPFSRTPARENLYRWIAPLLNDKFAAFAKADSPISSLEDCKAVTVGYQIGGPGAGFVKQLGFEQVEEVADETVDVRKLLAGRIGCWLGAGMIEVQALRQIGVDPSKLKQVGVVADISLFIAGSKSLGDAEAKVWEDALTAIKADGSYGRIVAKYVQ